MEAPSARSVDIITSTMMKVSKAHPEECSYKQTVAALFQVLPFASSDGTPEPEPSFLVRRGAIFGADPPPREAEVDRAV